MVSAGQVTVSIPAKGTASNNSYATASFPISSDYTIVSVATWATNTLYATVYNVYFQNGSSPNVNISLRNETTNTLSVSVSTTVLCILKRS